MIQKNRAEQAFRDFMEKSHPQYSITKKGLPDFMIMDEKKEVIGFVEVKRDTHLDNLRIEQRLFMKFCRKRKINYQVWSPIMWSKSWVSKSGERFKKIWRYGEKWLA